MVKPKIFDQVQPRFLADLKGYFELPEKVRRQNRPAKSEIAKNDSVVASLLHLFQNKCAYCESTTSDLEVDHFRPHQVSHSGGAPFLIGYYAWLSADWENLYLACGACLRAKKNSFPISGARGQPMTSVSDLRKQEDSLILDPCWDNPERHLQFLRNGTVKSRTEAGKTTIDVLNLNRKELCERRLNVAEIVFSTIRTAIETCQKADLETDQIIDQAGLQIDALISFSEGGAAFAGVCRSICLQTFGADFLPALNRRSFRELIEFFSEISPNTSVFADDAPSSRPYPTWEDETPSAELSNDFSDFSSQARHIRGVEIKNFKTIRNLWLDLPEQSADGSSWMAILGENGTGKSSFLQAVSLALLGAQRANTLLKKPYKVLTKGEDFGFIRVYFWDYDAPSEIRFSRNDKLFEGKEELSALVLGYGATRLPGGRRTPLGTLANVDTLVKGTTRIPTSIKWLMGLPEHKFESVARVLNSLLPIKPGLYAKRIGRTVQFEINGHPTTLDNLSGGYRAIIGMALDIVRVMLVRWENLEDAMGVVLIDELETHLHPRWKMRISHSLRQAFPRIQFIVSTHDPLILRGLRSGEVAVFHLDSNQEFSIAEDLPSPEGLRVDQLLTSEHFGLNSSIDPDTDELFRQYYDLLAVDNPTLAQIEGTQRLRKQLDGKGQLGETHREKLLLEAIDRHLAKKDRKPERIKDKPLTDETLDILSKLIESTGYDNNND